MDNFWRNILIVVGIIALLSVGGLISGPDGAEAKPKKQKMIASFQDYPELCAGGKRTEWALNKSKKTGATMIKVYANHMAEDCNWQNAVVRAKAKRLKVHVSLNGWTEDQVGEVLQWVHPYADYYSIWNEPNHFHTWVGPMELGNKTRTYIRHYKLMYPLVRAIDPSAKILFGEYAPDGGRHLRNSFKWMRKMKADGLAIHPYVLARNFTKAFAQRVKAFRKTAKVAAKKKKLCLRKAKGCKAVPIFVTEAGPHWAVYYKKRTYPKQNPAKLWMMACKLKLRMMSQFQIRFGGGRWDTALFNKNRSPRWSATVLRKFIKSKKGRKCIAR